jgi:general secretion pathway protein C
LRDLTDKLALPARWLLVAAIAYTLANTALYLVSPPPTAPGISDLPRVGAGAARPAVDVNAILTSQLFGRADASEAATTATTPTVTTQLPLELLGVFVADQADRSAAIVAQRGRAGTLYAIGENVPGNATLVEVQADHVVLRRAGIREALYFPPPGAGLAARSAAAASTLIEPLETS